jgi:hypothetical protein
MARTFRNLQAYWPVVVAFSLLVFLSATGIVVASPSWSHHIMSSAATVSHKIVRAAYHPAAPIDSGDSDYVAGLAKAVPGLVQH